MKKTPTTFFPFFLLLLQLDPQLNFLRVSAKEATFLLHVVIVVVAAAALLLSCCTGAVAVLVLVDPLSQMMCSLPNEALRNKVASRTRRNVRQLRGSTLLASLLLLLLLGATAMCINEVICTFFELLLTTNSTNGKN